MKSSAKNVKLATVDDLFSTEESRTSEKVVEIPLPDLHSFKNHPFKVRDDEAMMETADSVRQYGVLVPAIARPDPDGGYELIAGHRRRRASELAGKETMPVIVRDLDDDAATIIMVDSNLQREEFLPSERAFAYKMNYLLYWFEEVFSERVEATTRMVGAFLNMVFKEAVTDGYIRTNPVTETKPYKRQKPKIVVLGKEKIKVLLKAASKSSWYLEILLGLFCGLRKGEIMGLKFSDFDFEKNTVYINRQIVSNPKIEKGSGSRVTEYGVIEREPKTPNSYRTLRVPEAVGEWEAPQRDGFE